MRIAHSLEIAARPEAVWAILDDSEKIRLWIPEVVDTTYPHGLDKASPVGTRFVQRIREGGRIKTYDGEVRDYAPQRLLAVRLGDGSFSVDVTYRLTPQGSGTRLDYVSEATLKSWTARLMAPIGRVLLRSIAKKQLGRLKALAESGGGAAP